MAATYTPIAFTTLNSTSGTVSFTSISSTYTDLRVIFVGTGTSASDFIVTFNNKSSSTNYARGYMYATSTVGGGRNYSGGAPIYPTIQTGVDTTYPELITVDIQSYANTSCFKNVFIKRAANHNSSGEVDLAVGIWKSTAAISTVSLTCNASTFNSGSTFALYGIKAA